MTEANWQRYMADFMVAVRAALPRPPRSSTTCSGTRATRTRTSPASSPPRRTSRSRRASTTRSSPAGSGTYGFQTLAAFVERRQAAGPGRDPRRARRHRRGHHLRPREPAAARHGRGSRSATTSGPRRAASGRPTTSTSARRPGRARLVRACRARDFAHGIVLVNEPGVPTRTLSFGAGFSGPRRGRAQGGHAAGRHGRDPAQGALFRPRPRPRRPRRSRPTPPCPSRPRPRLAAAPAPPRASNPTASIAGAAEPGQTSVTRHRLAPGRLRPRQAAPSAATST